MTTQAAAAAYALFAAYVILFQLALAAGAPWGDQAMGGRWPGVLPSRVRVAEVIQSAVIAALALIVLSRAGLVLPDLAGGANAWLAWVPVAFAVMSLLANLASRSLAERRRWVPVAIIMLLTSWVVASSVLG